MTVTTATGTSAEVLGVGADPAMNSVLGKAKLILEAYTATDNALSLSDLVRRTGVAKATVHRSEEHTSELQSP